MELKFKKLQEDAVLPSYANPNDAGLLRNLIRVVSWY